VKTGSYFFPVAAFFVLGVIIIYDIRFVKQEINFFLFGFAVTCWGRPRGQKIGRIAFDMLLSVVFFNQ
jgi:hypothetical protein